jgi:hypothetical protein
MKKTKPMSYIDQMLIYMVDKLEIYDTKTIEYTKNVVVVIEREKGVIYDFFKENNIKFERFLEEFMFLVEFRLQNYGKVDLNTVDFEEVLDFVMLENDINNLIKNNHIESYQSTTDGSLFFIPDQFAVDFMYLKYDVEIDVGMPFDYDLFYEEEIEDSPTLELLKNICLN